MKKAILFILIFIPLLGVSQKTVLYNSFIEQSHNEKFNKAYLFSNTEGFGVSTGPYKNQKGWIILHTKDKGQSFDTIEYSKFNFKPYPWASYTVSNGLFGSVYFFSSQFGYAIDINNPYVYKTIDGGKTFQFLKNIEYEAASKYLGDKEYLKGFLVQIYGVYFFGPDTAIMVGRANRDNVKVNDKNFIFVGAGVGPDKPGLAITYDGFKTIKHIDLPYQERIRYVVNIDFVNKKLGYIYDRDNKPVFYTEDGGESWFMINEMW